MATAITLEDGSFVVGPLPADGRWSHHRTVLSKK
jgi:hypothetical protein